MTIYIYECPECGFIVKTGEPFLLPKLCLNCENDVILVLQDNKGGEK